MEPVCSWGKREGGRIRSAYLEGGAYATMEPVCGWGKREGGGGGGGGGEGRPLWLGVWPGRR